MTPKEKAKQLVALFGLKIGESYGYNFEKAKQCALVCANELITAFELLSIQDSGSVNRDFGHGYWHEVKAEIESKVV